MSIVTVTGSTATRMDYFATVNMPGAVGPREAAIAAD